VVPIGGTGNAEERPIPRLRLTKSAIDGLPVQAKNTLYWDAGLPALGVKVMPKGPQGFSGDVSPRGRGLAASQIYDRSLRSHHLADGTGASSASRRCAIATRF
jgi:hypothetical protein